MLSGKHLEKRYPWKRWVHSSGAISAVRNVSLRIRAGETIGLVGESGSGKSTLGRCLAGLEKPSAGSVFYGDLEIYSLSRREARFMRRRIQYIHQDPVDALNPYRTIGQSIAEPLWYFGVKNHADRRAAAARLLEMVELPTTYLDKYPLELSRGQCQRVNIARALIVEPEIIICDEVISALDVSTGVQILQLLKELQQQNGYGYLFISHDLSRVIQISDWIAVMYMGEIVEFAPAENFHETALHPYAQVLIEAVPRLIPGESIEALSSSTFETPQSQLTDVEGCPFHPRCPLATKRCREQKPVLRAVGAHRVMCHFVEP
ncbi:dipeptide/oligopeptide/nickel ABC transporter ATP-binding protein [Alicyclobacillus acidoterrestris]|uniref:oligopeptide/dipeptide ABC transporter ATP-binding protein n=1 Tax=Alicyclobacillus suci TaxID=2816080 RepID=UPI0011919666|nr:ABC transporter ATP-binding protein [Alicyclobacillus suci]GEO24237.1 dipeptide/oligopeptide/nickel ABC transporter ATP-binding protein [Alicyclobacillus acidoterrestris]